VSNQQQTGITALELIVTMTVVTILLAAGVPAIKNYNWNLRMRSAIALLQTDLNLARGRAISHNIQTIVCPAVDNTACSGTSHWQHGWIVFTDINGDRQKQGGEPLLKQSGAVEFISINSSLSRPDLRFFPNGSAPGSNTSIRFCDERGAQHAGRIIVSNSGRIRVETGGIESSEECP
jgi:type IV fimbrial biogenesis protein FimT